MEYSYLHTCTWNQMNNITGVQMNMLFIWLTYSSGSRNRCADSYIPHVMEYDYLLSHTNVFMLPHTHFDIIMAFVTHILYDHDASSYTLYLL